MTPRGLASTLLTEARRREVFSETGPLVPELRQRKGRRTVGRRPYQYLATNSGLPSQG
jgi:hypothetical protein